MKTLIAEISCLLITLALVCGFVCSCQHNDPVMLEPELQDGIWTGTGEGRSGTIVIRLTVSDHKVTDIVAVSQSESVFAQDAIREMISRALAKQGMMDVEVDAVSGATLTSTGVIDAVNMALAASLGQQTDRKASYGNGECDIVVVGAGGAGLSAAVEAASGGNLKIIILEKQGIAGGNTNYSTGGINAAGTKEQEALDITDSKEVFYDDTMRGGQYENDPALVRSLVEHAPGTVDWLTSLGADLSDVGLMGGSSVRRTHRPNGGAAIGPHLMKILKAAAASADIEIRTSNKVLGLLHDGERVTGVNVSNADGTTYNLKAKAVIIATGGFGANLDMVTRYQPSFAGFATLNHPGATGDAFDWIVPLGGYVIQMPYIQIHPTAEAESHILITEAVRGNGAILVNHGGNRFVNEMDTRDIVSAAILKQYKGEAFLLFDATVRKSLSSIETYDNQHLLQQGANVSELAGAIGVSAGTLEATLERYGQFQRNGTDEDFGRSETGMPVPLDTPPYYAVRIRPAIHHTMGGIKVDEAMRVIRSSDGAPVPGLFAAGEVTGGVHGANRLGGNGVADIVVNGKIAGRNSADAASLR